MTSAGEVRIAGKVDGNVTVGKLTLDADGEIRGTVEAEVAIIAGTLQGSLAAGSVSLASTARVTGDITHSTLAIETGAIFEGYSRRVENAVAAGPVPVARGALVGPLADPEAGAVPAS